MKKGILLIIICFAIIIEFCSAAVFTVTSEIDDGNPATVGTIRWAVSQANLTTDLDIINFNIPNLPGSVSHRINLVSELLLLQDVIIDGTTQPGYSTRPVIELYESPAMAFQVNSAGASGVTIKGVAITSNAAMGINLVSGNNRIEGCYIGVDTTGTIDLGNNGMGIFIQSSSSNNIIGGNLPSQRNVISGNLSHGIIVSGSSNIIIINNFIGTNAAGLALTPVGNNNYHGIEIGLAGATKPQNILIGGSSADSSNVISGNTNVGIQATNGIDIRISGNIIGLGADGSTAIGNGNHGLTLTSCSGVEIGSNASVGLPPFKNVISSNNGHGIDLYLTPGTVIQGNYIGTTANGDDKRGNAAHGIQVRDSRQTIIGGVHSTEGNLVADNGDPLTPSRGIGIIIDPNSNKSIIKGNYIGTDVTGLQNFGNDLIGLLIKSDSCKIGGMGSQEGNIISGTETLSGILIADANDNIVMGNLIGTKKDTTALANELDGITISYETKMAIRNIVQYNVVAHNKRHGINVGLALGGQTGDQEYYNNLRFNSIFCNITSGIFLNLAQSNNDGNEGIVAPQINTLMSTTSKIVGIPNAAYGVDDSIDIYEMIDCANCLNAQGKRYVATVVPDASGAWSYDHGSPLTGTMVAIVTDENNNTSQFSTCYTPCDVQANATASETVIDLNQLKDKTVTLTSTSTGSVLSPLPLEQFWILNSADTLNAFSTSTTASHVFSRHPFGSVSDTIYLVVKQGACFDTLSIEFTSLFIPNLITANGDQKNESWKVSEDPELFEAKIYNRWGDLVFWKDGYTDDWDVTSVNEGIYYYHLNDKTGEGKSYRGWVQVVK